MNPEGLFTTKDTEATKEWKRQPSDAETPGTGFGPVPFRSVFVASVAFVVSSPAGSNHTDPWLRDLP